LSNEFEAIERYFLPLTMGRGEAGALKDDAAVLDVPEGFELVVSSDILNEGVHFYEDASAAYIARKALRVNLSDMAAMGAKPYCYQLNLSFPEKPDEAWLSEFSGALLDDQNIFNVFCSGGDTTLTKGPLSICVSIVGLVPKGGAVRRSGARVGDLVVLTGAIGEARARSYKSLPYPRCGLSEDICRYARAAVDVSDGLIADLDHLCRASGLRARLELEKIPLDEEAEASILVGDTTYQSVLSGGEDYELVLAVAPDDIDDFTAAVSAKGVDVSVIGVFQDGAGVHVMGNDGRVLAFGRTGWTHF